MATYEQQLAAANTWPSLRTPAQHRLVSEGSGDQRIRNADYQAAHKERRGVK